MRVGNRKFQKIREKRRGIWGNREREGREKRLREEGYISSTEPVIRINAREGDAGKSSGGFPVARRQAWRAWVFGVENHGHNVCVQLLASTRLSQEADANAMRCSLIRD